MDYQDIISMMDAEIEKLEEAGRILKQGGKVDAAIKAVTPRQQKAVAMPKKHVLSPEGRARIAEAQRMRWAATKRANAVTQPKTTKKAAKKATPKKAVKRTMSPEARKLIGDAQRKRWAAAKKLKSAAPTKATKKAAPKKAANAAPAVALAETPKAEATS